MTDTAVTAEVPQIAHAGDAPALLAGEGGQRLLERALPAFLARQRWFAGKAAGIAAVTLLDSAALPGGFALAVLEVAPSQGATQRYLLPLQVAAEDDATLAPFAVARLLGAGTPALLHDAAAGGSGFAHAFLDCLQSGAPLATARGGALRFAASPLLAEEIPTLAAGTARRLSGEQSNTNIVVADRAVLKLYRQLQPGASPELEIGRFLTDVAHFANAAPMLGSAELVAADGTITALAVVQGFLRNRGDAWAVMLEGLTAALDAAVTATPELAVQPDPAQWTPLLELATVLGRRTAEMHRALATPTDDPDFAAEPFLPADLAAVVADVRALLDKAVAALQRLTADVAPGVQAGAEALLARRAELDRLVDAMAALPVAGIKTRIHGDYHLGQVLVAGDDVFIVDFEGEPARGLDERRAKAAPLRDVAGMLRSFGYASGTAVKEVSARHGDRTLRVEQLGRQWLALTEAAYLGAYNAALAGSAVEIPDPQVRDGMARLFLLSKALYEVIYEANNRPTWIDTPLMGVLAMLDEAQER